MSTVAWLSFGLLASIAGSPCSAAPASNVLERAFEDWATQLFCKVAHVDNLDSYSPYRSECPGDDFQWIRPADSLSSGEKEYLDKIKPKLDAAWQQRMRDVGLDPLPEGRLPVVAMALSGGGYRAMISGSGMAFQQNTTAGSVGDILAVSTYMAGLSGGSWAVGSLLTNDGRSPDDLAKNVWNLDQNLVFPKKDTVKYFVDLFCKSNEKERDGFDTGITDLWALALSEHLFPEQFHGTKRPDLKWTEIPNRNEKVKQADLPYPIVVAIQRSELDNKELDYVMTPEGKKKREITLKDPIWEFTLTEFGTWQWGYDKKSQGAFTPIRYLGTRMINGKPSYKLKNKKMECWEGFDQAGFVVGTSSSLFNAELAGKLRSHKYDDLGLFAGDHDIKADLIEEALKYIDETRDDIASYKNPFRKWKDKENPIADREKIQLVDGGEAEQNIPIEPFLQDARHVDAISAFDNSKDTESRWPDGRSLSLTYERAKMEADLYGGKVRMPRVPSPETFVNSGMNTRPVFFGCEDKTVPTIIYIPNYSWSTASNTDTFKLDYSLEQTLAMIENGRRALDLNGTVPDWGRCLTCAMIDNAVLQAGRKRDDKCAKCLAEWCWDGKEDNTAGKQMANVIGTLPALPISVPVM